MQQKVFEPTEQSVTRYKNERSFEQSFVVWDNGRRVQYKFAPGEEKTVPSIFDFAVHRVLNGTIVGGEAPQLTNLDRPDLKLASYLDTEAEKRREAEAKLVQAQLDKQKAEQEALLAAARLAQAEAEAKAKAAQASAPSSSAPAEEKKK